MKIEILYPEFCQWFGDSANARYLRMCVPEAEAVETGINDVPSFVNGSTGLLIMGSMTERQQLKATEKLLPYRDRLMELIDSGMAVLATGNSVELFGKYISDSGTDYPMLSLFPFHAERDMVNRHNSLFIGDFEDMIIVGCKSQFSALKGNFPGDFIHVRGGSGNSPGDPNEGFRYKNLFATYLLGPFLISNPLFTRYLLRLLGHNEGLALESEVMEAYEQRKQDYCADNTVFFYYDD